MPGPFPQHTVFTHTYKISVTSRFFFLLLLLLFFALFYIFRKVLNFEGAEKVFLQF